MGALWLFKKRSELWTGLMLFTLTCNVQGFSQEESQADATGLVYPPPEIEDPVLLNYFRAMYEEQLLQQMLARRQGASEPSFEGLSERLPLPLAFQGRQGVVEDGSSKEVKRGGASSYMNLCHFKICQIGKKRSNARLYSRFQI